jgi:hypothetical protein
MRHAGCPFLITGSMTSANAIPPEAANPASKMGLPRFGAAPRPIERLRVALDLRIDFYAPPFGIVEVARNFAHAIPSLESRLRGIRVVSHPGGEPPAKPPVALPKCHQL